jgi:peptide/nickel transport system permease protein
MHKYIIKRLFGIIPVMIGVTFLVFLIMSFSPGDPAQIMLGDAATPELVAELREEMGLNDNILVQYGRFVTNLLKGDFGTSYRNGKPVLDEIALRFPYTLKIAIIAIAIGGVIAIPLGVISAIRQNTVVDGSIMVFSLFAISMPQFWFAMLLIMLFSIKLGWLPTGGARDGLRSLILPSITLGLASMAAIARITRSSMLEVIRQDYIRTAKAKGVPSSVVTFKHGLRNALIPTVTVMGLYIGLLLGGAVLTETVFAWPGIGRLMVESILAKDTPTVLGCITVFAFSFSIVNLLVDILYAYIDPRIKAQYV